MTDSKSSHRLQIMLAELLALAHRGFPSEDEQEQLYEGVAEAMAPRPVTIRTLDLGGDKVIPDLAAAEEENPQLGWRSIRISLSDEETFRAQLRAILRASAHGNVRLLIPMLVLLVPPILVLLLYPLVARLLALMAMPGPGSLAW